VTLVLSTNRFALSVEPVLTADNGFQKTMDETDTIRAKTAADRPLIWHLQSGEPKSGAESYAMQFFLLICQS
jgi:hypothetical protein